MLPIMNIYADLYMYNATGDALGYSEGNFQSMMDYIEESGGDMGFFFQSIPSGEYNPFSGNIFDVNEGARLMVLTSQHGLTLQK